MIKAVKTINKCEKDFKYNIKMNKPIKFTHPSHLNPPEGDLKVQISSTLAPLLGVVGCIYIIMICSFNLIGDKMNFS